tara:strand:- start:227 stop:550 length:324 start_codon:yes stop_codon:yes gene_type:complete
MSKENKEYPNWNQIYGILGNSIYGIYDAKTAEKIKPKGQEVLKELLEQRLKRKELSKLIYATIKGEKVVIGNVNKKKEFTFHEDIDMSIVSKKIIERLKEMYKIKQR